MPLNPQQRINRFEKNFSSYRLIFVVILSCVLMYQDYQRTYTEELRTYLSAALYPIQYLVNLPRKIGKSVYGKFLDKEQIINENNKLKEENLNLRIEAQKVYSLESENKGLREIINIEPRPIDSSIFAEIISINPIPNKHQILINKGSRDGTKIGSTVIDSTGIVGHIIRDQIFASEVLLVTDLEHAIPVEIVRTQQRTIAVGTGDYNKLRINSLATDADIKQDDVVVTSGLGGRYPKGWPIGTVKEITSTVGNSYLEIDITPFADLTTINQVWILTQGN